MGNIGHEYKHETPLHVADDLSEKHKKTVRCACSRYTPVLPAFSWCPVLLRKFTTVLLVDTIFCINFNFLGQLHKVGVRRNFEETCLKHLG